jgi:hypothetical protein
VGFNSRLITTCIRLIEHQVLRIPYHHHQSSCFVFSCLLRSHLGVGAGDLRVTKALWPGAARLQPRGTRTTPWHTARTPSGSWGSSRFTGLVPVLQAGGVPAVMSSRSPLSPSQVSPFSKGSVLILPSSCLWVVVRLPLLLGIYRYLKLFSWPLKRLMVIPRNWGSLSKM